MNDQAKRARSAMAIGSLSFFAVVSVVAAFYDMFRNFAPYDDEGYVLLTVKQFMAGNRLYVDVFTQYGPFYYLFNWLVFATTRFPISHDSVRALTLFWWVIIPVVYGWSIYRVTRSVVLAVLVQFLVFAMSREIMLEPGHPVALCGFLLALAVLASSYIEPARPNAYALALFGVLVAALSLTKINAGGLLGIAAIIGMLAFRPRSRLSDVAWTLLALTGMAVPFILVHAQVSHHWARNLAIAVTMSFLCMLIAMSGRTRRVFGWEQYGVSLLSAFGFVFVVVMFMLLRGTSPQVVLEGVLLGPLRWVHGFVLPLFVQTRVVVTSTAALLLAIFCRFGYPQVVKEKYLPWVVIFSKAAFGIGAFLSFSRLLSFPPYLVITYELPFLFLALVPNTQDRNGEAPIPFYRVLWCLIAVFASLQAYPVGGTDAAFAVVPMIVVAALCLGDCAQFLMPALSRPAVHRFATALAVFLVLLIAGAYLVDGFAARRLYLANEPLDLPGTSWIRLPAQQAEAYRYLTNEIKLHADIFIGLPGLNSFYFWTGEEPPTRQNAGHWMDMLSDADQEQIIGAMAQHSRAAVIYSPELVKFWLQNGPLAETPLVRYISQNFKTVDTTPVAARQAPIAYWNSPLEYRFMIRDDNLATVSTPEPAAVALAPK